MIFSGRSTTKTVTARRSGPGRSDRVRTVAAQAPWRSEMQDNRALLSAARWLGGGWAAAGSRVLLVRTCRGGKGQMWAGVRFTHRDFWEHPSHLCPYSGGYLFFFLAPFDARPGPWLYLARVQLMGAHPHQQPATAGHTSTKTPAEIRKAMAVGLAVIAAGGHERRFVSGPPFTGRA